jgi:hypothetical protein
MTLHLTGDKRLTLVCTSCYIWCVPVAVQEGPDRRQPVEAGASALSKGNTMPLQSTCSPARGTMTGRPLSTSSTSPAFAPHGSPLVVTDPAQRLLVRAAPDDMQDSSHIPGQIPGTDSWSTNIVDFHHRLTPNVVAPARCNCAGFCDYCSQQGCQSPRCIDRYLSSWWAVCDQCGGLADDGYGNGCPVCVLGVIQVMPGHPGAVQPR